MVDSALAKQRLRQELLAARRQRGPADVDAAGEAIARHGLKQWRDLTRVASYLSTGFEPPTRRLVDALAGAGVEVVVPVVTGEDLDWVGYSPGCAVASGPLGVDEPTGPRLGADVLATVGVVIAPALAVDRAGVRLGRGRGYYDRALVRLTAPVVAVVYDDELLDAVPAEPHDRRVEGVLRPSGYVPL